MLFLGFATNLILACILTITAYNAVGALMALIFAFINATCLFFLMELEFIGLLFIIVYLGAVCVLFLFSVMLFNLKDVVRTKTTSFILTNFLFFILIAILFSNALYYINFVSDTSTTYVENFTQINLPNTSLFFVGQVLYGRFLIYLILVSMILLIAMLGAVILINNPKEQSQMQSQLHQMTRKIQITNNK